MFSFEEFEKNLRVNPSVEIVTSLKRAELMHVAKKYNIPVDITMKKVDMAEILIEYLVDEDILDTSVLKHSDTQPWLDSAVVLKVKQLELKAQAEAKQLELQAQAEAQTAKHEHEISMKKLDIEYKQNQSISAKFDITKHIRLAPPFNEKDADKYFFHILIKSLIH